MKTRVFLTTLALAGASALSGLAAIPTTLTFSDLAGHMDRWPAAVTVLANVRTKSGQTALQGQRLRVVNVTDKAVFVQNTSGGQVGLSPEQCDVVKAANEYWAKLTPEQRALAQSHRGSWPQLMICDRFGRLLYEGGGGSPNDIAAHLAALNKHVLAQAN